MRQQNYIYHICDKDVRFLDALRMCNHLSPEQARNLVSQHRINNYIKQGVVKPVYSVNRCNTTEALAMTAKGRIWTSRNVPELHGKSFYHSETAVRHNLGLATEYLRLRQEHPDATFYTEQDIREHFNELIRGRADREELRDALRDRNISVPDMMYRPANGDNAVAVEVTTSNYSPQRMDAKLAFARITEIEIQYFRY